MVVCGSIGLLCWVGVVYVWSTVTAAAASAASTSPSSCRSGSRVHLLGRVEVVAVGAKPVVVAPPVVRRRAPGSAPYRAISGVSATHRADELAAEGDLVGLQHGQFGVLGRRPAAARSGG